MVLSRTICLGFCICSVLWSQKWSFRILCRTADTPNTSGTPGQSGYVPTTLSQPSLGFQGTPTKFLHSNCFLEGTLVTQRSAVWLSLVSPRLHVESDSPFFGLQENLCQLLHRVMHSKWFNMLFHPQKVPLAVHGLFTGGWVSG